MFETDDIVEKFVLVGVDTEKDVMTCEACLLELEELVKTAGGTVLMTVIQKRQNPSNKSYVGKGKLEEIKILIDEVSATGIVCDDELSPSQIKNMEEVLQTKIVDRTMLILDIFAKHAISKEGIIQVELAQLKYRLKRLVGIGASMSRLGGGIGTRGPGEKKLETDRRYIKDRISELKKELNEIEVHRSVLRSSKIKKSIPKISTVGYTNAGKSTLLNTLTDAGVLAENKLFATLDTTIRSVKLPQGAEFYLADTVGFIQKLPHHLIEAFKATLEELKYSDVLLHIIDASSEFREEQMEVVYNTLKRLNLSHIPVITVYNKIDVEDVLRPLPFDLDSYETVEISAKNALGTDDLLTVIENLLKTFKKEMQFVLPYAEGSLIGKIHQKCDVLEEEHTADGVKFKLFADDEMFNRLLKFVVAEE